jgi:beta-lactamase class A
MRPFDVDANGGNFDALMICAVTDLARNVNKQMRAVTDGTSGLYLREIGGSTLAALHSGTQFEPASMLKTLHHVHAMRQVRLGNVSLATKLP